MRNLFTAIKKQLSFTHKIADKRQEALIAQGRTEFKKLVEKGLAVPVMFL